MAGSMEQSDVLAQADAAMTQGDFAVAESILKDALTKSVDMNTSRRAVGGLFRLFTLTKDKRIRDLIAGSGATAKGLETYIQELSMLMSSALGELDDAQVVAEKLRKASPGTDLEVRALIHMAGLRFFSTSKDEVSLAAYKELITLYGEKVSPGLLNVLAPPASSTLAKWSNGDDAAISSAQDVGLSAYPNPFNPTTVVRFTLREPMDVTMAVYDALGREVAVLLHGPQEEGVHSVEWNGRNTSGSQVASGVYFVRMTTSTLPATTGTVATKKILLMK
jgi:hypothetical protein